MKRILFIIVGLFIILFARELSLYMAPTDLDKEFYLLGIISYIAFGNILCLIGIFFPFKQIDK